MNLYYVNDREQYHGWLLVAAESRYRAYAYYRDATGYADLRQTDVTCQRVMHNVELEAGEPSLSWCATHIENFSSDNTEWMVLLRERKEMSK